MQVTLSESPHCAVSIPCWEPGQVSPIHGHPEVEEISHGLEGEGLFRDGKTECCLGPRGTVVFPPGEVQQVQSLTRMVLYRIQAGADGHAERPDAWPAS